MHILLPNDEPLINTIADNAADKALPLLGDNAENCLALLPPLFHGYPDTVKNVDDALGRSTSLLDQKKRIVCYARDVCLVDNAPVLPASPTETGSGFVSFREELSLCWVLFVVVWYGCVGFMSVSCNISFDTSAGHP